MVYTNSRATMKWLDPQTNKIRYFSSAKLYEQNNHFGKGWSPGSELIIDKKITTIKIDLSYHPFIKYHIF